MDSSSACTSSGGIPHRRGGPADGRLARSDLDVSHGALKNEHRLSERGPERFEGRGEGSAAMVRILSARLGASTRAGGCADEPALGMASRFGSGPPWLDTRPVGRPARRRCITRVGGSVGSAGAADPTWLDVGHREIDVGHVRPPVRQAVGSSPPVRKSSMQYGVCSMRTVISGRGQPSRFIERPPAGGSGASTSATGPPMIAVSTVGRAFSSTTAVDPPWLAVRHREVDVGYRGGGHRRCGDLPPGDLLKVSADSHRTFRRCVGSGRWARSHAQGGISPPICNGRALEWISRVRGDCWSMNRNRLRNKASTTRSCTSDAEHEFSRARSPGWYPKLSFRDARCPQLLLMRPSSVCKGESDYGSD